MSEPGNPRSWKEGPRRAKWALFLPTVVAFAVLGGIPAATANQQADRSLRN